MIMLQYLRDIFLLFLSIFFLALFKNCRAFIQETQFTRLPDYDDTMSVDFTQCLSVLEEMGRIQCGLACSVLRPHCAGVLYNFDQKSCILLKSHLNNALISRDPLYFGWRLLVNAKACQPGWSPFDGHCYYLAKNSAAHDIASAKCQQHGGYLVETDSEGENTWITQEFRIVGGWIWIGINDKVQDTKYRWTRPSSQVTFTGWRPNEPSGGTGRHCGGLGDSGDWNDMSCETSFRYLCERDF